MVDRRSFLIQYYYQYPQPLEKHLFYAVCAIGCQFRPRTGPIELVPGERKVAKCLRDKALEVMRFAYKRSSVSMLQTLLIVSMLSPNSEHGEGSSTNWLILVPAIRMSQDLDILREDRYPTLSNSEVELRRRLAYCVYMWDKYSAAATGKPYTVRDEDFYVQVPSLYELKDENSISINKFLEKESTIPRLLKQTEEDIRNKQPMFYLHVNATIPMSRMIGQILTTLYLPKPGNKPGTINDIEVDVNMISDLDARLIQWRQAAIEQRRERGINDAPFEMFYNGGILLLYRPLMTDAGVMQKITTDNGELISNICTKAAIDIIDYIKTTPVWGIPCVKDHMVTMCATIFLHNCNHKDSNIRLQALRNLRRCADIYKCDDIISQCQNATVLDELSKQLMLPETGPLQELGFPEVQPLHEVQNERESTSSSSDSIGSSAIVDQPSKTLFTRGSGSSYTDVIEAWHNLQQEHEQLARHDLLSTMGINSDQLAPDI